MVKSQAMVAVLAGALSLLVPAGSAQQAPAEKPSKPGAQKPFAPKAERKHILVEVTRISTEEAARSAAKDEAKKRQAANASKEPAESSVLEFQPAASSADATSSAAAPAKDSKKSALKNVHGEAHGALDPKNTGNRRAGGAVGASSKSGKTSVYVETDRSRTNPPTPH